MHITWDPENGEPVATTEFDPEDILNSEAMRIEKEYGASFDQWLQGVRTGEAKARKILLWFIKLEATPKLQFRDVPDFRKRQLKVEMSSAELRDMLLKVERMRMDESTREQVVAQLEVEIRDAVSRETGIVEADSIEDVDGQAVELPKQQ